MQNLSHGFFYFFPLKIDGLCFDIMFRQEKDSCHLNVAHMLTSFQSWRR